MEISLGDVFGHQLIDPFFGVIHSVKRMPLNVPAPKTLHCYAALCSNVSLYEENWRVDRIGTGCGFSAQGAAIQAVGEAIERYCGNIFEGEALLLSPAQALRQGMQILNPYEIPFFSIEKAKGFQTKFKCPDEDDLVHWHQGKKYTNGRVDSVWMPMDVTHLKYDPERQGANRLRYFPMLYAGIAAHQTEDKAVQGAFHEVLERHHTYLWWYGSQPAVDSTFADFPGRDELLGELAADYAVRFFVLSASSLGVAVGCALERLATGDFLIGFSAKQDYADAAPKALCEALQLHEFLWSLTQEKSWIWQAWQRGEISKNVLLPPDADADAETFSESLLYNLQFYQRRGSFQQAKSHFEKVVRADIPLNLESTPGACAPSIEDISKICGDVYVADLTTSDINRLGLKVVRVYVPSLLTNTAHHLLQDAHPAWHQAGGLNNEIPPLPHA